MNPFGFFHAIFGGFEMIAQALGRKRRPETRRERISFWLLYVVLMLLGVGTVIVVAWQLYFQP